MDDFDNLLADDATDMTGSGNNDKHSYGHGQQSHDSYDDLFQDDHNVQRSNSDHIGVTEWTKDLLDGKSDLHPEQSYNDIENLAKWDDIPVHIENVKLSETLVEDTDKEKGMKRIQGFKLNNINTLIVYISAHGTIMVGDKAFVKTINRKTIVSDNSNVRNILFAYTSNINNSTAANCAINLEKIPNKLQWLHDNPAIWNSHVEFKKNGDNIHTTDILLASSTEDDGFKSFYTSWLGGEEHATQNLSEPIIASNLYRDLIANYQKNISPPNMFDVLFLVNTCISSGAVEHGMTNSGGDVEDFHNPFYNVSPQNYWGNAEKHYGGKRKKRKSRKKRRKTLKRKKKKTKRKKQRKQRKRRKNKTKKKRR